SVIGDTPLLLKNKFTNEILINKIKDLSSNWSNYHNGKESCEIDTYQTWTETGWTDIKRVIRHKLESNKKLLKIQTHNGEVIVTDEHSLLNKNGKTINAKNVKVGDNILHSFPSYINNIDNTNSINYHNKFYNKKMCNELAYILGCFMKYGLCDSSKKCFTINNKDINLIESLKKMCENIFDEFKWKISSSSHLSDNIYKLVPFQNEIKLIDFIKYFTNKMYNNGEKKVPQCILNSSKEYIKIFLIGLYPEYKLENNQQFIYTCKNNEFSLGIYYLIKKLGYHVKLNSNDSSDSSDSIYTFEISHKLENNNNVITKITEWEHKETYVYDLTTENHHFHAGVGSIIVHN
nr:intein [Cafeteria roenbergensis virus BV-PW1]